LVQENNVANLPPRQRWSNSGFIPSNQMLFFTMLYKSWFRWNHVIHIRQLSKRVYLIMHRYT